MMTMAGTLHIRIDPIITLACTALPACHVSCMSKFLISGSIISGRLDYDASKVNNSFLTLRLHALVITTVIKTPK
jgi:hypothetical protein